MLELTLNKLKGKGLKCNIEKNLRTNRNGIFVFLGNTQWCQAHK